jgi:hypothetical protein
MEITPTCEFTFLLVNAIPVWTLKLHSSFSVHAGCAALAFKSKPQNSTILHRFMVGVTPVCQEEAWGTDYRHVQVIIWVSILFGCTEEIFHLIEENFYEYLILLHILKCSLRPSYWGDCRLFPIHCFNSVLACCESKRISASLISVIIWTQKLKERSPGSIRLPSRLWGPTWWEIENWQDPWDPVCDEFHACTDHDNKFFDCFTWREKAWNRSW